MRVEPQSCNSDASDPKGLSPSFELLAGGFTLVMLHVETFLSAPERKEQKSMTNIYLLGHIQDN
jgi:hypothetical protein